jgi:hypothetical protein
VCRALLAKRFCVAAGVLVLAACSSSSRPSGSPSSRPPSAGSVPADYIKLGPDLNGRGIADILGGPVKTLDPKTSVLVGPLTIVGEAAVAEVPALNPDQAFALTDELKEVRPGTGREVVVVELDGPQRLRGVARPAIPEDLPASVGTGGAQLQVTVDGVPRSTLLFGAAASQALVLSVPTGHHPVLSVRDQGRSQSIDLVTGVRGRDAIEGFYPVRHQDDVPDFVCCAYEPPGTFFTDLGASVSLTLTLQPWTGHSGWAPTGRLWLHVGIQVITLRADLQYAFDPARTFSLSIGSGPKVRGQGDEIQTVLDPTTSSDIGNGSVDFSVPASFRSGTMDYQVTGVLTTISQQPVNAVPINPVGSFGVNVS